MSKECPPWLAGRRSLRLALEEDREQVIRKTGFIQCSRKFLFWGGRERGREGGREEGGREGGGREGGRETIEGQRRDVCMNCTSICKFFTRYYKNDGPQNNLRHSSEVLCQYTLERTRVC